jgi:hypothetical protein
MDLWRGMCVLVRSILIWLRWGRILLRVGRSNSPFLGNSTL